MTRERVKYWTLDRGHKEMAVNFRPREVKDNGRGWKDERLTSESCRIFTSSFQVLTGTSSVTGRK